MGNFIYKNLKSGYAYVTKTIETIEYEGNFIVPLSQSDNKAGLLKDDIFTNSGISGTSYTQTYLLNEPIFVEKFYIIGQVISQANAQPHLKVTLNENNLIYERNFGYGFTNSFESEIEIDGDGLLVNSLTIYTQSDRGFNVNNYSSITASFYYSKKVKLDNHEVKKLYLIDSTQENK